MKHPKNAGFAFIALAITFFAVGISTNRTFFGVAVVFLVIGILFIARSKRN
jgi:4-hydroxybenzoate polyprenyltransferase